MSDPRHAKLDRWYRRMYRFGTDDEVPSVTTINKAMASYNLEQWKVKRAVDTTLRMATRSMREVHKMSEPDAKGQRHDSGAVVTILKELSKPSAAATQGINVHEALEAWFATGSMPTVTDAEAPYVEQAIRWAMEWNPRPLHMEPECYAEGRYAGSIDGVFQIGHDVCLVDYKTGGVFESAAMQLAAYAHADRLYPRTGEEPCAVWSGGECECVSEPMPVVDRMAVLDLKPDSYELKWVTPIASGLAWRAFEGAIAINRLKKERVLFATARRQEEQAA